MLYTNTVTRYGGVGAGGRPQAASGRRQAAGGTTHTPKNLPPRGGDSGTQEGGQGEGSDVGG